MLGAVALVSTACGGGGSAEPIPNTASSTSTTASTGTTEPEAALPEADPPATAPADTSPPESTVPDTAAGDPSVPAAFDAPPSVVAWGTGGLPEGTAQAVHESGAIASTTVVVGGSLGLVSSAAADGASVDQTAEGRAIPLDTLAYDPASYRPFVSDATADALSALGPDEALLGATSAELRRVGIGGTLAVDSGRTLTVKGEVPDAEVAGAEVLISPGTAADLGIAVPRFLLALPAGSLDDAADAVRSAGADGPGLQVRTSEQTDWLRHADAVAPQALIKRDFGEFAVGAASGREVTTDQAWVAANIVTETVPLLGEVRCHRRVIEPLRRALEAVESSGVEDAVNPGAFAGCFNARGISPGSALSRHSWGIALDLNVTGDPRGRDVSFASELVDAMRKEGFRSGADWLVPDPAHFEFYPDPTPD